MTHVYLVLMSILSAYGLKTLNFRAYTPPLVLKEQLVFCVNVLVYTQDK